jgi:hypothetical protein
MKRTAIVLVAMLAITATLAGAATTERWLHIRVEEGNGRGERVKVNLPLSMLGKVAGAIDLEEIDGHSFRGGRIHIDDADIDHVDLRAMWDAVKEADDMEFVSIESTDEDVSVAKDQGYLLVRVRSGRDDDDDDEAESDDDRRRGDRVDIKVPLAVVDALLSAGEKELDLQAALMALAESGEGELVVVEDGSSSVRIWIDDQNTSE